MKETGEDQVGPRAACGSDSSAPMKESFLSTTLPFAGVTAITGHAVSLAQLTEVFARNLRMPVWDQTGFERKYDFAFCFAQDLPVDSKLDFPSLFTAVGDLGLTLRKERGPLESLVVDRLDQPSEN